MFLVFYLFVKAQRVWSIRLTRKCGVLPFDLFVDEGGGVHNPKLVHMKLLWPVSKRSLALDATCPTNGGTWLIPHMSWQVASGSADKGPGCDDLTKMYMTHFVHVFQTFKIRKFWLVWNFSKRISVLCRTSTGDIFVCTFFSVSLTIPMLLSKMCLELTILTVLRIVFLN